MLKLEMPFSNKSYAEQFKDLVCSWFQGSEKFIKNDIVVTPVYCDKTYSEVIFYFDVYLDDGHADVYLETIETNKFLKYMLFLELAKEI